MKKIFFFIISLVILIPYLTDAHPFEWRFVVKDGSGNWVARHVYVYKYNSISKILSYWVDGTTIDSANCDCNGGCDINDAGDGGESCPDSKIWNTLSITVPEVCLVVVEGDEQLNEEDYYCKIMIPANLASGLGYDFELRYTTPTTTTTGDFYLPPTSNQRGVEFYEEGKYEEFSYTIRNDFSNGIGGGLLKLDNSENLSSPQYPVYGRWTWPRTATAIDDQIINSYKRKFAEWQKDGGYETDDLSFTLDKEDDIVYTAKFDSVYTVTIQNELPGYGNSGTITVEGNIQNSPYMLDVVPDEDFTGSGITQTINSVQFTFAQWYKNGSQTQETSPFTPSSNDTYTAMYDAQPLSWYRQMRDTSNIGEAITLTWNDHPNPYVTSYQIWRKVGSSGTPIQKGTVNAGVEIWTDPDYTRTGDTSDPLLQYDVRAYYGPTGSTSAPNFENGAYGFIEETVRQEDAGSHAIVAEEISSNYFIGSYPNPFNPQTTIKYNLPTAGYVSLKVYNSIGKEITELVNGVKEAGSYSVDFDGTDLASGIYIYSIRVNNFIKSGKMLLVK